MPSNVAYTNERLELIKKESEQRRFINKFIYEIQELSFYEATTQLINKIEDIYLQWNNDI
jgi:hypothetical protein